MKTPLRLGAFLLLCAPYLAFAEGSKQLTPNTNPTTPLTDPANTRAGFLTHDAIGGENVSLGFLKPRAWGTTGLPFTEDYRMYVRLKPGETMHYGVHRLRYETSNYTDLMLTVRYGTGDGTIVKQTTLNRDAASPGGATLTPAQDGVIATAAEALQGPRALSASGYRALTYTNNTGSTRDFYVEFTQVGEFTDTGTQPGFNDLKTAAGTAFSGDERSEYDFWDFTVIGTDNQEKPGRLFSRFWAFTAGTSTGASNEYQNRLSATFKLFPLVESKQFPGQHYVKEVELAGLRPLVFGYVTNEFGSAPVGTATDFATRRKSQTGNTQYAQYPNFVNNPDVELWPSAPVPTVSVTPQSFCRSGVTQVAFTTNSAEDGQFDILLDLDTTPGYQAGGADVLLFQAVKANVTSTVIWNGLDGLGNRATNGKVVNFQFISSGAAFNFPVYDAEGNPDGFRVRNVRPATGTTFDRLYWDDSNLPTTRFPAPQTELAGQVSTNGVHIWGVTNDDGNTYTVNTWTYGFAAFTGAQTFTYNTVCDNDQDGVADNVDIDDDNDGILDVVESYNSGTVNVDPSSFRNTTSAIAYLDAGFVHPILGAFRDSNNDGVNDIFDTDRDGIPNHFDLDSDNDGILDAVEANGNVVPNYTFSESFNGGTKTSAYNPTLGRFMASSTSALSSSVGDNGLPDAVKQTISYKNNGSVDTENAINNKYTLTNNDGDTFASGSNTAASFNFLDVDSDNDGITDEIEAQTTASYATRVASTALFNRDSDKDGIRDVYDANNGGSAIGAPVNSGGSSLADMFDFDSDGDNNASLAIHLQSADWTEGFDVNGNGIAGDELLAAARAFATNNPAKASYYAITNSAGGAASTTLSVFLQDADNDDIPNFLDLNSTSYHDDNFNGLVDLFDPAYGGTPSTAPRPTTGGEAYFRNSATRVPLPVTLLSFQAQAAGRDALLTWATAQEINSLNFVVEGSSNGVEFEPVGVVGAQGTTSKRTDYRLVDKGAGAQAGIRYYRLRQNDRDGKFAYTPVSTVVFDGKSKLGVAVLFPNPTAAGTTLDLSMLPAGSYAVEILGAEGRKVAAFTAPGGQTFPLPTQTLSKGVYLVRVGGNGVQQVVKLVRE